MSGNNLTNDLIFWYSRKKRDLPWRIEPLPYKVWISEIILQQTRVQQGLPYYFRFIEKFPTVKVLAEANLEEVLKEWEGLGYYSRARNMHEAAKQVMYEWGGSFPDSYKKLLTLKGVGEYTAAAISSICFNEPVPVVDGNVFRVFSRLFRIKDDIAKATTKKLFRGVIKPYVPETMPGEFNQAVMELGALICSPKNPKCNECPVETYCEARKIKEQSFFPVKSKISRPKNRHFDYYIIQHNNQVGLRKRSDKDIWNGLYEFHLHEKSSSPGDNPPLPLMQEESPVYFKHQLSHQTIHASFHEVRIDDAKEFDELLNKLNLQSYSKDELVNLPKPKLIINYLNQWNQ